MARKTANPYKLGEAFALDLDGRDRVPKTAYLAAVAAIKGAQLAGRPEGSRFELMRTPRDCYTVFNPQVVSQPGDLPKVVSNEGMFWDIDGWGDHSPIEVTATPIPQTVGRRLLGRPELVRISVGYPQPVGA